MRPRTVDLRGESALTGALAHSLVEAARKDGSVAILVAPGSHVERKLLRWFTPSYETPWLSGSPGHWILTVPYAR